MNVLYTHGTGSDALVGGGATFPLAEDGSWSGTIDLEPTGERATGTYDFSATCSTGPSLQDAAYERGAFVAHSQGQGYLLAKSAEGVHAFGDAWSLGDRGPAWQTVGIATRSGRANGSWLVSSDGGIATLGRAQFKGALVDTRLSAPVVGISATPTGEGYWLVGADGGVFAFGDAPFSGSLGATPVDERIVGIAPTASACGYWLVGARGGVFAFGDAPFHGSLGGTRLDKPIVGIAATTSGGGYWLVGADGGVFAFGDAPFHGSLGGTRLDKPIVGTAATTSGGGYWLVGADGGVFAFGDAPFHGSGVGTRDRVVAIASS